jgi:hypothetical protein
MTITYEQFPKIALEDILDDLSYEFSHIPVDALEHYVRRAAIIMCRNGDLARQKVIVRTQPNVPNYLLEPSDDSEIVALMDVKAIDGCMWSTQVNRVTARPTRFGVGATVWFEPPNELFIHSDYEGTYAVDFSVAPTRDACEIPAVLYNNYYEVLMSGARYFVHDVADKPWTDKKVSMLHYELFLRGIKNAKIDSLMGFQRGFLQLKRQRVV